MCSGVLGPNASHAHLSSVRGVAAGIEAWAGCDEWSGREDDLSDAGVVREGDCEGIAGIRSLEGRQVARVHTVVAGDVGVW